MKIERTVNTPQGRRLNGNWLAIRGAAAGGIHLIHGPRGCGKSTAALVGLGVWIQMGVTVLVVRQSFPAMRKLWEKALEIYQGHGIRPVRAPNWEIAFPNGAKVIFRPVRSVDDVKAIQGHDFAGLLADEVVMMDRPTWVDIEACMRWPDANVPIGAICTANPYGDDADPAAAAMGAEWVHDAWIKGHRPFRPHAVGGDGGTVSSFARGMSQITHYPTRLEDNPVLAAAQPLYLEGLRESLRSNQRKVAAWCDGLWTTFGGAAFADVWDPARQVIPSPLLRGCKIPETWELRRCLDWAVSAAWCYLVLGISDGRRPLRCGPDGQREFLPPKGDVVALGELYGWDWNANCGLRLPAGEVARMVSDFEREHVAGRVRPGPGDLLGDHPTAAEFERAGVPFVVWRRPPGSRAEGFRLLRAALWNSYQEDRANRVAGVPGVWVTEACPILARYLPRLPQAMGQDDLLRPVRKRADYHDHPYDALRCGLASIVGSRVHGGVTGVLS